MTRDFRAEMDHLYSLPAETAESATALGQFMHVLLNPESSPGPPCTHTSALPDVGYDEWKPYRVDIGPDVN